MYRRRRGGRRTSRGKPSWDAWSHAATTQQPSHKTTPNLPLQYVARPIITAISVSVFSFQEDGLLILTSVSPSLSISSNDMGMKIDFSSSSCTRNTLNFLTPKRTKCMFGISIFHFYLSICLNRTDVRNIRAFGRWLYLIPILEE